MYEEDFGQLLRRLYPGKPEAEALTRLLNQYGSFRAMAKKVGASLATISRWGRRLGVTPPPVFPHWRVIRALIIVPGDTFPEKLKRLKEEEGTWIRVAARLRVTIRELKIYRYTQHLVPRDKWKERQELRGGLEHGEGSDWKNEYWTM